MICDVDDFIVVGPETNVSSPKFNAKLIGGSIAKMESGSCVDALVWDIGDSNDTQIVVELGTVCIINHLKINLFSRSYSYYVELSVNCKDWERVVDFTEYVCRSYQTLYFEPRSVRYIKLDVIDRTELNR